MSNLRVKVVACRDCPLDEFDDECLKCSLQLYTEKSTGKKYPIEFYSRWKQFENCPLKQQQVIVELDGHTYD